MSRGITNDLQSPVKKEFQWDGDKGGFKSYNKATKENEAIPLPFRFLVLDLLNTIKGFNDQKKSGYWANEVRFTKKDVLSVYSKGGLQAEGLYTDIIGTLTGAKYCQVVYICYYEGKDLVLGKLNLMGAAVSAWIEFCKGINPEDGAIEVAEMTEGKKGKTVYQIPVFKVIPVSKEADEIAIGINLGTLKPYLDKYISSHAEAEPAKSIEQNIAIEDKPSHVKATQPLTAEQEANSNDLPF